MCVCACTLCPCMCVCTCTCMGVYCQEFCPGQTCQVFHSPLLLLFRHYLFRLQPRQAAHQRTGKKLSQSSRASRVISQSGSQAGLTRPCRYGYGGAHQFTSAPFTSNVPPLRPSLALLGQSLLFGGWICTEKEGGSYHASWVRAWHLVNRDEQRWQEEERAW